MKYLFPIIVVITLNCTLSVAQDKGSPENEQLIIALVDAYSQARAEKDPDALREILVSDIDQLVSTGEWRRGFDASLSGMLRSSASRPGSRTLTVENVRFITDDSAIADARYEITNDDGSQRKMWSTFVVVKVAANWKIAAIRNMLPAK